MGSNRLIKLYDTWEKEKALPEDWDDYLFHIALCCVRSDPTSAFKKSPMEVILGRLPTYPFELPDKNKEGLL